MPCEGESWVIGLQLRGQGRIRQQSTTASGIKPDFSAKNDKALGMPFLEVVMYDYSFGEQRSAA
jgi:hypothetical protein